MIKYYMRGTPWEGYEALMMAVPRFNPRGGGRKGWQYRYKAEDVDCKYCAHYNRKGGCGEQTCPFIQERLEAGVLSYQVLLNGMFPNCSNRRFMRRVKKVMINGECIHFLGPGHRSRLKQCLSYMWPGGYLPSEKWLAALFVLTTSPTICRDLKCGNCPPSVDWSGIRIEVDNLQDYVILQTAKTIFDNQKRITLDELANPLLVDDDTFSVIIDTYLIMRYGQDILTLGGYM